MTVEHTGLRFPFAHRTLFEPPEEFASLREQQPVARVTLPTGDEAWLVTRYADVRAMLSDARLSRAATTKPGAPRLGPARPEPDSMMAMDPPGHTRLRKLVAHAFTARRTERLRPRIQEITDGLLSAMEQQGKPADLVEHLARPLPLTVICELLGVPDRDRDAFRRWTDTALSLQPQATEAVAAAREALNGYLAALAVDKLAHPGADLLSVLALASEEGDRLSKEELAVLAATLLTAGYHTVANAITNGTAILLTHPEQLAALTADPTLIPNAVEELVRYTPGPVSGGTMRIATRDLEIGGVCVRAGEAVIPSTTSANRDAEVFACPNDFDVAREHNPHIGFGPGIHHCLGAQLARIELQTAFGSLLHRFPGIRLAVPPAELTWNTAGMIRGFTVLPVEW